MQVTRYREVCLGFIYRYASVFKNTGYMIFVQGANFMVPLLLIPLLIQRLGIEMFGLVSFMQAIVGYLMIVLDYGFNYTATRRIAQYKDCVDTHVSLFYHITIIKLLAGIVLYILLAIGLFMWYGDIFKLKLFSLFYVTVLGGVLLPVWLFQGLERVFMISILNFFNKVVSLLLVVLLIHTAADTLRFAAISAVCYMFMPLVSIVLLYKWYGRVSCRFDMSVAKSLIYEGFYAFMPSVFSALMSNAGIIFLGVMASAEIVGVYASLEKLIRVFIVLMAAFTTAIYPRISMLFSTSYREAFFAVRQFGVIGFLAASIFSICCFFGADVAIELLLGSADYIIYANILKVLSLWVVIGVVNNFMGVQYLLASGNSKFYAFSVPIGVCTAVLLMPIGFHYMSVIGIPLAMLIGEIVLMLLLLYFIITRVHLSVVDIE